MQLVVFSILQLVTAVTAGARAWAIVALQLVLQYSLLTASEQDVATLALRFADVGEVQVTEVPAPTGSGRGPAGFNLPALATVTVTQWHSNVPVPSRPGLL